MDNQVQTIILFLSLVAQLRCNRLNTQLSRPNRGRTCELRGVESTTERSLSNSFTFEIAMCLLSLSLFLSRLNTQLSRPNQGRTCELRGVESTTERSLSNSFTFEIAMCLLSLSLSLITACVCVIAPRIEA